MAANQPTTNDWSNANCLMGKWHKTHVGRLKDSVCVIRRDLIGCQRRWL